MESSKRKVRVNTIIAILVVGVLAAVIWYVYSSLRQFTIRVQTHNNLKGIGLALLQYHDDYGSFPPVTIDDASGRPLHSWRTLIEPQLEAEPELSSRYEFEEPWDSDANIAASKDVLLDRMHYRFFAVTGPDCAWTRTAPRKRKEWSRSTSDTALVIGVQTDEYTWRQPVDIDVDAEGRPILDGMPLDPNREYFVLYADGMVRCHPEGEFADILSALTITDEEADPLAW